jgi:hypothetical protein
MRPLVILSLISVLAGSSAGQGPTFQDPQGRFTLQAPPGWKVTPLNNDAVQLANAPAFVTVMVLPGEDAQLFLDSVARQTGSQWRGFTEARRGETQLGGVKGAYVTYAGTNPMGADSYLELIAITGRNCTYLMMISAPKPEFARFQSAFDRIEKSFTLTAGITAGTAAPPAPAGAQSPSALSSAPMAAKVAPSGSPAVQPTAGTGGYYRMKKVTIVDERGFERPMPALSLLIPSDWQFQGGVQYAKMGGCHANLVQVTFRATSPDGRMALEMFPGNTWQWSDDPNSVHMMQASNQQMAQFGRRGCDIMPPQAAGDFLKRQVIPGVRRDARVEAMEPMPEIAQEVSRKVQQAQAAAAQQGMQVRARGDVGRARLAYSVNGQPVEEWMTAVTYASGMAGPSFNMATGRMGQTMYYSCAAEGVFGFRAPQGQLDSKEHLFLMMLSTVQADSQWYARVLQVIANMQAADTKGAADRSKIIAQSGQDISKIIHDTYENKKKADDRSALGFSQYLRGVETYRNPNTGETVELSNQYGHAWAGNGEYILSDSANFDPNVSLRGNWTRMEPVKQ